ncbi:MAG: hypothetical protein JRI22_23665 [Deltaproteobacteria bacterium]|nr:hypothetical protein [Deltaproteobacteria bacterium]
MRPVKGDLSLMASIAAIELDRLSRDKSEDVGTVRLLSRHLKELLNLDATDVMERDPRAVVVVDRAILNIQGNQELPTVPEILSRAREMIDSLQGIVDAPESAHPDSITRMIHFCIELSKTASSHKTHPFSHRKR